MEMWLPRNVDSCLTFKIYLAKVIYRGATTAGAQKCYSDCVCCRAERRKAASQPEAVSAEELKSLLVLTRERFLGSFDALAPTAVSAQTDKMKSAGMANGKVFYSFKFWW